MNIEAEAQALQSNIDYWKHPSCVLSVIQQALQRAYDEGHQDGFEAGLTEAARSIGENGL